MSQSVDHFDGFKNIFPHKSELKTLSNKFNLVQLFILPLYVKLLINLVSNIRAFSIIEKKIYIYIKSEKQIFFSFGTKRSFRCRFGQVKILEDLFSICETIFFFKRFRKCMFLDLIVYTRTGNSIEKVWKGKLYIILDCVLSYHFLKRNDSFRNSSYSFKKYDFFFLIERFKTNCGSFTMGHDPGFPSRGANLRGDRMCTYTISIHNNWPRCWSVIFLFF